MKSLNISIGEDVFRRLREDNRCYVDKTSFIEELILSDQSLVTLITRPRRFGKTLNLTMLHEFFDIQKDSKLLFEGLDISKNSKICKKWMNQYPTIFISCKGIEGNTFSHSLEKFALLIQRVCSPLSYILASDTISDEYKENFTLLSTNKAGIALLEDSLLILSLLLQAHWGRPAILLIDEYDVPIYCAERNGYYKEMVGFIRNLFGAALKTNAALQFAVLTGCLRIAKESIFTGMNNFACFGISDSKFADKFGFTSAEVDVLLEQSGLTDRKDTLRDWYDGYVFGHASEMYCPWDVLHCISDFIADPKSSPKAYWKNTSGNAIVRKLISQAGEETREKIEILLSGGSIEERLVEELTYDDVYTNERNLWTLLYLTGYLTKAVSQPENGKTALVIPNKELRMLFMDTVTLWFEDTLDQHALIPFTHALWSGDAKALQEALTTILYSTISFFDSAETYYHGFMAGLLRGAGLNTVSNRENGLGRTDLVCKDTCNRRALIFELKLAKEYGDLETCAEKALAQIEEKKYAKMLAPRISKVLKYGIAFWKKECCVLVLKSEC